MFLTILLGPKKKDKKKTTLLVSGGSPECFDCISTLIKLFKLIHQIFKKKDKIQKNNFEFISKVITLCKVQSDNFCVIKVLNRSKKHASIQFGTISKTD